MFCTNCGSDIEDGSKFCIKCGAPVEDTAPAPAPAQAAAPSPAPQGAPAAGPGRVKGNTAPFAPVQPPASDHQNVRDLFSNDGFAPAPQPVPAYGAPAQAPKKKSSLPIFIGIAGVVIVILIVVIMALAMTGGDESSSSSSSSSSSTSASSSSSKKADPGAVTLSATTAAGQRLTGTVHQDSNGYVLPDSSSRLYTIAELRALNLTPAEICVAWNEPFARLGYHFGNSDLANYFASTSWYHDSGTKPSLSGVAAKNNELLRQLADEMGEAALWKDLVLDNN